MEWTKEELKKILKMVGRKQYEFTKEGFSMTDARTLAADEVGKTFEPPLSGENLQQQIGYWLNKLHKETRDANRLEKNAKEKTNQVDADNSIHSGTDIYRSWCKNNNHVATDIELAFFTGYSSALFSQTRAELKNKGFQFEKNQHGWNIVQPVKPELPKTIEKKLSEQDIQFLLELLKKFRE